MSGMGETVEVESSYHDDSNFQLERIIVYYAILIDLEPGTMGRLRLPQESPIV